MTRLNSILAVALCILAALVFALSALPVRAQLPGRQQTPVGNGSPDDIDDWEVIGVAIRHRETGEVRVLPFPALVAPTPTDAPPTVAPTHTPTPTPSPTLTPSATPSRTPTATPTATSTPGQGEPPTPTEETTPQPSPPPSTDIPRVCEGGVAVSVLNVRSDHSTSAGVLSKLYIGERVTIERMYVIEDARREWAYVRHADTNRAGWVASYFTLADGTVERYLVWDDESEWCYPPEMPVEWAGPPPISTPLPVRNPIGLHMIWGTDTRAVLDDYLQPLAAAGLCPSTMKALDLMEYIIPRVKAVCPETRVVYRTIICGDYPGFDQSPEAAADAFYLCAKGRWLLSGADAYEPMNESPAPAAWKARFSLRLLELGTRDGLSLVVPGDGPGSPEIADYASEYTKLYAYILAHPDAGHAISTHAYGLDRYLSDSGLWLGFRHRLFYEAMRVRLDGAGRVPVYLTEIGPYGAFRGDPITCAGLADDMARYAVELRRDPYVRGAHLFTTGHGGGEWYAVDGCLGAIADALRRALQ